MYLVCARVYPKLCTSRVTRWGWSLPLPFRMRQCVRVDMEIDMSVAAIWVQEYQMLMTEYRIVAHIMNDGGWKGRKFVVLRTSNICYWPCRLTGPTTTTKVKLNSMMLSWNVKYWIKRVVELRHVSTFVAWCSAVCGADLLFNYCPFVVGKRYYLATTSNNVNIIITRLARHCRRVTVWGAAAPECCQICSSGVAGDKVNSFTENYKCEVNGFC